MWIAPLRGVCLRVCFLWATIIKTETTVFIF